MRGWRVRAATAADVEAVVDLLNEAGARLASRGLDQWGVGWMNCQRMLPMIERGQTWLADDDSGVPFVTVSLSEEPDPDFWTPEEQKTPALYMNKLASRVRGAGEWAMKWALHHASTLGYEVVRLDAWATNTRLHEYYRARGWTHLRTMHVPGRRSGALFEKKTTKEEQQR